MSRRIRLLLVGAAFIWSFSASPGAWGAGGRTDLLRLFYWQGPTIFNPHLTSAHKDLEACRITYEPLATADEDGALVPVLAARIPSVENGDLAVDGRSVTWRLKAGVRWSDGAPFTAGDVLATYRFIVDPRHRAVSRTVYAAIERLKVLGPHTVRIFFRDVNPAWSIPFVGPQGMILPGHVLDGAEGMAPDELKARPADVGTGPFWMSDVAVEDTVLIGEDVIRILRITYEAHPRFREPQRPHFRRIRLHGGGDAVMAARAVLVEGSADFAWNLQLDQDAMAAMAKGGTGRVVFISSPSVERILLNRTDPDRGTADGERSSLQYPHPFFRQKKVRQAFAHAVDREAIAGLYCRGARATTNLLVSPPVYASPNTAGRYPYDLERAARLLEEAGWTDTDGDGVRDRDGVPMHVVFQTSVNPLRQKTQRIIKRALGSIGVAVELKMVDASVFFANDPENTNNLRHFYADLAEYSTGNHTPDPGTYMAQWTCDQVARKANLWSSTNYARWCSREYDALYAAMTHELDPAKRRDLFIRMNDLLIEDVALIPLVVRALPLGLSGDLDGVRPTPWDRSTWSIQQWRRRSHNHSNPKE